MMLEIICRWGRHRDSRGLPLLLLTGAGEGMYTCVGEQSRSLCPTPCGEFRVEERCAHPSAVDSVHPDTKLGGPPSSVGCL